MTFLSEIRPYDHQTFEYNFCTRTSKLSNQIKVFIRYVVLIGCFVEYRYELMLKICMIVTPEI
jgi:hypothetical protein